jgi:hypothetical protein
MIGLMNYEENIGFAMEGAFECSFLLIFYAKWVGYLVAA